MSCNNVLIFFSIFILIVSILLYYSFDTSYEEIEMIDSNAKCMDGSNYKFLFSKGYGNGTNSFYIFFEPGGFCGDNNYNPSDNDAPFTSCLKRKYTPLGNNKFDFKYRYFNKFFARFLASSKYFNPLFYNWNKVFVKYCDGALHIGNNKEPIIYNNTKLYIRGEENVKSVFDFLINEQHFSKAKDVMAVGSSAGALAVVFYSKYIRSLLPKNTNFKVISDSGYFEHGEYKGINRMKDMMQKLKNSFNLKQTETMKDIDENLDFIDSSNPKTYVNKLNNDYNILFLTSSYDSWALKRLVNSTCFFWSKVYDNCNKSEISHFEKYSNDVEKSFNEILVKDKKNKITVFMPKAFYHMLILYSWSWTDKSYGVNNYSVYNFIHDWYYDLLPKGKKIFKDSENVLKRKVDIYWYFNFLFPDF